MLLFMNLSMFGVCIWCVPGVRRFPICIRRSSIITKRTCFASPSAVGRVGVDVVVSVAGLVVVDTGVADDAGGAAAVVALSFDVDEPGGAVPARLCAALFATHSVDSAEMTTPSKLVVRGRVQRAQLFSGAAVNVPIYV